MRKTVLTISVLILLVASGYCYHSFDPEGAAMAQMHEADGCIETDCMDQTLDCCDDELNWNKVLAYNSIKEDSLKNLPISRWQNLENDSINIADAGVTYNYKRHNNHSPPLLTGIIIKQE